MDANYIVMIVMLIIWGGLFGYLWSIDRKVNRLEQTHED